MNRKCIKILITYYDSSYNLVHSTLILTTNLSLTQKTNSNFALSANNKDYLSFFFL